MHMLQALNLHGSSLTVSHLHIFNFYLARNHTSSEPQNHPATTLQSKTSSKPQEFSSTTDIHRRLLVSWLAFKCFRDKILFSLRVIAIKQRFFTSWHDLCSVRAVLVRACYRPCLPFSSCKFMLSLTSEIMTCAKSLLSAMFTSLFGK